MNIRLSDVQELWMRREWGKLKNLDLAQLAADPDRASVALLVASACIQLADRAAGEAFLSRALEWGCDPREVARVLVADIHNLFAREAALAGRQDAASIHYRDALEEFASAGSLASLVRSFGEFTKLGQLQEAADVVEESIEAIATLPAADEHPTSSHITILRSQIELLRHELSLAQQRGQLGLAPASRSANDSALYPTESGFRHSDLTRCSVSQLGQDLWVLEKTGYKQGGYFVEFGATDGVLLSNTWLLEKWFGWRGICAEPNPLFFKKLQENRKCLVSSACIGAQTGEMVEFVFADEFGGIADFIEEDNHIEKRRAYQRTGNVSKIVTISLNDFLEQQNAPRQIDYLSIDTEGSELEILRQFPFDRWHIALLTVEHNYSPRRTEIRRLMFEAGYRVQEAKWDDWFYRE